jgi:hypothetical protein
LRAVPLLILALLLAGAAPARAAEGLEVGMEDERLLLTDAAEAPAVVGAWRDLGIDVVRLHASWARIAPTGRRRPRGFEGADHRDPLYQWAPLDRAIGLVRAAGMRVMLTVTGPGPVWTSREPRRGTGRFRPDAREFGRFARAVATRYGDDVDRYLIWNEPNLNLAPIALAPHLYRGLVRSAGPAIEAADPGAEIVIGELAPTGGNAQRMAPLLFLRKMACVDERYRRVSVGRCRGFRPAAGDSLGYHPHGLKRPPDVRNPNRDEAQFSDLSRLMTVADRLTRRGRIVAPRRRLGLRLTEFGYQTRPPDRFIGVSLAQQARYLQLAAYLAWRHPRVRTLVQYQWRDEAVRRLGGGSRAYAGWQSGLRFLDDTPKPAMRAFELPLVAVRGPGSVLLWGQARPGAPARVAIQRRPLESRDWIEVAAPKAASDGTWSRRLVLPEAGRYRVEVLGEDGAPTGAVSGEVTLGSGAVAGASRLVAASVGP